MHHRHKTLNWIWKLKLLPKIKFFLLLVLREALPKCQFLIPKKLEITNTCFCNQNSENIDHIVKCFPFVQDNWDHIKYNCPILFFTKETSFLSLNGFIIIIKLIVNFSSFLSKNLTLSYGMFGPIGTMFCLGK